MGRVARTNLKKKQGRSKQTYDLILRLWPLVRAGFRLGNWPGIGALVRPFYSPKINQAVMLPVNEAIAPAGSVALPYELLKTLVRRAGARVIMNTCLCRSKEKCNAYPCSLGCLFLGEGARQIHPSLGRFVSEEEALAHIQSAMQQGLMPLIVHTVYDALALNIPFRRMLTVCFCCECCCAVRRGLRVGPPSFRRVVHRLPGLALSVDDACCECGACQQVCPVQAILMNGNKAVIANHCVGCGLCVPACPNAALTLQQVEGMDILTSLLQQIERLTDIEN